MTVKKEKSKNHDRTSFKIKNLQHTNPPGLQKRDKTFFLLVNYESLVRIKIFYQLADYESIRKKNRKWRNQHKRIRIGLYPLSPPPTILYIEIKVLIYHFIKRSNFYDLLFFNSFRKSSYFPGVCLQRTKFLKCSNKIACS